MPCDCCTEKCCCVDGSVREGSEGCVGDGGTVVPKPANPPDPEITVEWCGITCTALASAICAAGSVICYGTPGSGSCVPDGYGEGWLWTYDGDVFVIITCPDDNGACNIPFLSFYVTTNIVGSQTFNGIFSSLRSSVREYEFAYDGCADDVSYGTTGNCGSPCGGCGHPFCDDDPLVTVTLAP